MTENESDGPSLLDIGSDVEDPVEDLDEEETLEGFVGGENETIALDQVRRAVRKYGEDGITVSEIEEVTELNPKTIRKHLDTLRRLREVYRQKKNKQLHLYYPNGRPLHSFGRKRIESGDTILDIQLAEGRGEEYAFHITEKRYSLMEGETTEGAVIFPKSMLDEVFTKLQEFAEEAEE
jgi:predicted ArsR family transcriptional regulator